MDTHLAVLGRYEEAASALRQALDLARSAGDVFHETVCLGNQVGCAMKTGEFGKSILLYKEGLKLARDNGNVRGDDP